MKAVVCLLVLLVCWPLALEGGDKKKAFTLDTSYLEKTWGLKLKSHQVVQGEFGRTKIRMLLEFTKDVEDVKEMRKALTPPYPEGTSPGTTDAIRLWFYCLDDDNVVIGKVWPVLLEGELSGVKGHAFRLFVPFRGANAKAHKVEVRPAEKKADKK